MSKQDQFANSQEALPIDENRPQVSSKNGRKNNPFTNQPADRSRRSFMNKAGGLPAVMKEILPLLHGDALTVSGKTVKENVASAPCHNRGAGLNRREKGAGPAAVGRCGPHPNQAADLEAGLLL